MKLVTIVTIIFGVLAVIPLTCGKSAPEVQKFEFKADSKEELFIIPELGAILLQTGDQIKVEMPGKAAMRAEAYQEVDLKKGDIILMLNGKKITALHKLQDEYNALAVGQDVKLAVKDDKGLKIVSFPKADPSDLPQRQMFIINTDNEAENDSTSGKESPVIIQKIITAGDNSTAALPELGAILMQRGESVIMQTIDPQKLTSPEGEKLPEGDRVLSIQGQKISALRQLMELYEQIPAGEKVTLELDHQGQTITKHFNKAEAVKKIVVPVDNSESL